MQVRDLEGQRRRSFRGFPEELRNGGSKFIGFRCRYDFDELVDLRKITTNPSGNWAARIEGTDIGIVVTEEEAKEIADKPLDKVPGR